MKKKMILLVALAILVVFAVGISYAIGVTTPTVITYVAQTGSTMQGFTAGMCASMDTYTTQVLTDTRDNQKYRVRKMPDGRCWMIDNLKLANFTLTSANSNVISNFTIPANPVQGGTTRGNGICVGGVVSGTGNYLTCDGSTTRSTANYSYVAYSDPTKPGQSSDEQTCLNNYQVSTNSLTGCGYIYNWYTATAGTGTYDLASGNAVASICPAGWRLPTGGNYGEFAVLNNAMATGATTASISANATTVPNWHYNGPFEGAMSGGYNNGFSYVGYLMFYWTSSANAASNAFYVDIETGDLNMSNDTYTVYGKNHGMAVRCVAS